MDAHIFANLIDRINEWMDDNSEESHWPNCYMGGKTAELMADASRAVFDAVVEFQQYAKAEGFFETK